jgi:hypothetical protein
VWKPFVVSFPIAVLLVFACSGQTQSPHGGPLRADWTQIPIQDNGDVLDIVLKPVDGMDWIVGVKVRADGENALSVGDGSRGRIYQMVTGEHTGPPRIVAHPSDQIRVSGSSVSITGGTSGQVLVAYLDLTSPRSLTIHDSAGLASFAYVKDGTAIGNGRILRNSLTGRSQLAQLAMLFGAGPDWLSLVPEIPARR